MAAVALVRAETVPMSLANHRSTLRNRAILRQVSRVGADPPPVRAIAVPNLRSTEESRSRGRAPGVVGTGARVPLAEQFDRFRVPS